MVLITIVAGAHKPSYNWGASHCICKLLLPRVSHGLKPPGNFKVAPLTLPWCCGASGPAQERGDFFLTDNSAWENIGKCIIIQCKRRYADFNRKVNYDWILPMFFHFPTGKSTTWIYVYSVYIYTYIYIYIYILGTFLNFAKEFL